MEQIQRDNVDRQQTISHIWTQTDKQTQPLHGQVEQVDKKTN